MGKRGAKNKRPNVCPADLFYLAAPFPGGKVVRRWAKPKPLSTENDKVVSLFSGAGGFSLGFSWAGIKPEFGVEINKDAAKTYEANIQHPCHVKNIEILDPDFLSKSLSGKAPFAVIGGPPCQGFSTAGLRQHEDARNKLIYNYLNIVEHLQPRWFIFENVEGILTSGSGQAVFSLVREFLAIGYSIRVNKINFASYGVPQTRKRVLIIGNRVGIDFDLPPAQYSYDSGKSKLVNLLPFAPTVEEAISGLGNPSKKQITGLTYPSAEPYSDYDKLMRADTGNTEVTDHFSNVSESDTHRFSLLAEGQTMKDLPIELWHPSYTKRAFRRVMDGTPTERRGGAPSGVKRLYRDRQSLTITSAASREFIHPTENRPLTLRECARLQSFPDSYCFVGNAASRARQIGNAVPPIGAKILAEHLMTVDGRAGGDTGSISHHSSPRLLGFLLTESSGMSPALQKTHRLLNDLYQPSLALW